MSALTDDEDSLVAFSVEEDLVTATDLATGIAASGRTRSEALAMLADALELHEGGGEPIEDEDAFLRDLGIDPASPDDAGPPPWLE